MIMQRVKWCKMKHLPRGPLPYILPTAQLPRAIRQPLVWRPGGPWAWQMYHQQSTPSKLIYVDSCLFVFFRIANASYTPTEASFVDFHDHMDNGNLEDLDPGCRARGPESQTE